MMDYSRYIIIKGAYEHNLKHIDVNIPVDKLTCVTGCSGGGKSSLVYDTIFAASQRELLDGFTVNLYGHKIMDKPKVNNIYNLLPAINLAQNYYNVNPRSTIGTVTEVSYFLRSLFALSYGSAVRENEFSSNNPSAMCKCCGGLGTEMRISEELLIPDRTVKLKDGAIAFYSGPDDGKSMAILQAICNYYGININKKVNDLTDREYNLIMYADDVIKQKITYKDGKRKKQHNVILRGAIPSITMTRKFSPAAYSEYYEMVECHECNGAKLSKKSLEYTLNGMNYYEIESLEIIEMHEWVNAFHCKGFSHSKKELASEIIDDIIKRLTILIKLRLGYLSLNRSIPTLSTGEAQRVRIARQLNCSLKGILYILDEPCKGLHPIDVDALIDMTRAIISRGNTVIAIDHNHKFIREADNIIELGPVGGPSGGYVVETNINHNHNIYDIVKSECVLDNLLSLRGVTFRNIINQDVSIPINKITFITGISGSGKSSLAYVIAQCIRNNTNINCNSLSCNVNRMKVVEVNQTPIGKNPRSLVVSYLDIYDDIRLIFANTDKARTMHIPASYFSTNVKGGRCEFCNGTGFQKIELAYLPTSYITCSECNGKRFNDNVLSVDYQGMTILDVLNQSIDSIINIFSGNNKIYTTLRNMINLGLGYIKLGQPSISISGGESQRLKLAKALSVTTNKPTVYIMDEPTTGLDVKDIDKLSIVLKQLLDSKHTVIIIEHNIEFIAKCADYIIDMGKYSGKYGGKIVAQGVPLSVIANNESSLLDAIQGYDEVNINV